MPEITLVPENQAERFIERYDHGELEAITIDNDAYLTNIADNKNIVIDNRNLAFLLMQLINPAGTNGFDYRVIAHAKETPAGNPPALDEPPEDWQTLTASDITVNNNESSAQTLSDDWTWVVIQLKRTTPGQNSIASVYLRDLRNPK